MLDRKKYGDTIEKSFIHNGIKRLIFINKLSCIHTFKLDFLSLLFVLFSHVLNTCDRIINIDDWRISFFKHFLCKSRIATSRNKNFGIRFDRYKWSDGFFKGIKPLVPIERLTVSKFHKLIDTLCNDLPNTQTYRIATFLFYGIQIEIRIRKNAREIDKKERVQN